MLQLRLLGCEIEPARIAFGQLIFQDIDHAGIGSDEIVGRVDLRLGCAQTNRSDDHVRGQRGVGRHHLKARLLFLRLQRLHGSSIQAENVGRVGNAHFGREQIVLEEVFVGRGRDKVRLFLTAGRITRRDARIVSALLRKNMLARGLDRSLRRLEVVSVLECLIDQIVERLGMKQCPPIAGKVAARDKILRLAAGNVRRGGGRRKGLRRICADVGRRRLLEVRSHRTTRTQEAERENR